MIARLMPPRRATGEPRRVTVCGKVSPDTALALERIAEEMSREAKPATVTLSQLIAHVLEEFVEKTQKKKR